MMLLYYSSLACQQLFYKYLHYFLKLLIFKQLKRIIMTTKRCDICNGKQQITSLGGIMKQCPGCQGVGHVKIEQAKDEKKKRR